MSYTGAYINLDRSPDRRTEIEGELVRHRLAQRYRRFAAIDGNLIGFPQPRLSDGEMGCFTSHYLLLKQHLGRGQHLHVVEDDTIFASCFDQIIGRIIESREFDDYDIIYTDVSLPLSNEAYRKFKTLYDHIVTREAAGNLKSAAFQVLKLDPLMFVTANAYLVNKNSIEKIYNLFHEELMRGAEMPVDGLLRANAEAGVIKAGCLFPFITSVRVERIMNSLVRKVPDTTLKFTAAAIGRYSFFIDCDWDLCEKLLAQLPKPLAGDRHAALLSRVLDFSLLDMTPRSDRPSQAA
jgi:GR25 family glycosyltransferase involved in LPS biosynthesis